METEDETKNGFVKILIYEGVSPKRYLEFFKMNTERKKDGKKIIPDNLEINPIVLSVWFMDNGKLNEFLNDNIIPSMNYKLSYNPVETVR